LELGPDEFYTMRKRTTNCTRDMTRKDRRREVAGSGEMVKSFGGGSLKRGQKGRAEKKDSRVRQWVAIKWKGDGEEGR
jgi:hypothetical protein